MPSLPNILFITLDQWRADALGVPGAPDTVGQNLTSSLTHSLTPSLTPSLSALAREATVFTRHYCQAFPCGPARASLMTGLYAEQHRIRHNNAVLDAQIPTLFDLLRSAGYDPTLFGYTDVTDARAKHADGASDQRNGLNVNTLLNEDVALWIAHLRAQGYAIPQSIRRRDAVLKLRRFDEPTLFDAAHSEAAFLTDRFLTWLPSDQDRPFCAHLSYYSPHPPFAVPAPFDKRWSPDASTDPCRGESAAVEAAQHPFMHHYLEHVNAQNFSVGLHGLAQAQSLETIRRVKAIYASQVSEVDAQLGRLFDALRARGQWDNTVVVVTADHGEQLFDHWLLGKSGYFDQSAHIPLIIRLPDTSTPLDNPPHTMQTTQERALRPASMSMLESESESGQKTDAPCATGKRVDAFTESIDIVPTLLALVNVGLLRGYAGDGRNLLPFCRGETPALWRDEVHWQYDFSRVAKGRLSQSLGLTAAQSRIDVVRTARLKYVHFAGMPPVLFDLSADPAELINRADDVAARTLLEEGHARWQTWLDMLDA